MEKDALFERIVRLGASDVTLPGGRETPRLVMRKRSPEELETLQNSIGTLGGLKPKVEGVLHRAADKVFTPRIAGAVKGLASTAVQNPEIIPMQAAPIPGLTPAYLAGKRGLEKLIDKVAPIAKRAFATSQYSYPLNPSIPSQASHLPGFLAPNLQSAVQKRKQAAADRDGTLLAAGGLSGLAATGLAAGLPSHLMNAIGGQRFYHGTSDAAARGIKQTGLDPAFGGHPSGATAATGFRVPGSRVEDAVGKMGVTTDKGIAREYANISQDVADAGKSPLRKTLSGLAPHRGTVVTGTMPHEEFGKHFQLDPNRLIGFTEKRIPPEMFNKGVSGIIQKRLKDPTSLLSYMRENPGRAAKGIGALAAIPVLGLASYKAIGAITKKKKEAAGAPTRGNFYMASDIPAFNPPNLQNPIQKRSGASGLDEPNQPVQKVGDLDLAFDPAPTGKKMKVSGALDKERGLKRVGQLLLGSRARALAEHAKDLKGQATALGEERKKGGLMYKAVERAHARAARAAFDAADAAREEHGSVRKARLAGAGTAVVGAGAGMVAAKEKDSDMLPDFVTYGPGDFKRSKYAMPLEEMTKFVARLREKAAAANGIMGVSPSLGGAAQAAKSVGAPKLSGPGPSIAQIAKPKGPHFGSGIAGAFKGSIGGRSPQSLG